MADTRFWVEIIAALTIPTSLLAVVFHRIKSDMGMGYRAIQFLAMGTAVPAVIILGLEKIIEPGTVGALLGAVLGYVFSTSAKATSSN